MSRWKHGITAAASIVAFVASAAPAWAETDRAAYINGALRKLGRGIANVATCPAELIRVPSMVGRRDGLIAEATTGVVQGIWQMLRRGVVGVFEVATFYAEVPEGFEPIITPEYVWTQSAWAE